MVSKLECTCAHICPDATQCTAIWIHDIAQCWVACEPDPVKMLPPLDSPLPLDARIGIETRDATVAGVGAVLGAVSAADLLVPVGILNDRVIIDAEETTLGEVAEQIGLVVRGGDDERA
jgi:hypothetical protein